MSVSVGQFGSLYFQKGDDGWQIMPGYVSEVGDSDITVVVVSQLEPDIDVAEQRVFVIRATVSDSPPVDGERIFVIS